METFDAARCLVTGGAGFIGSNIVAELLARGARVTVLDDLSTGDLDRLNPSPQLEIIRADLATEPNLGSIVGGHDYVFHLAAQVSTVRSIEYTEDDAQRNIFGSIRLFAACRESKPKKLVYSSSSAIFGEPVRVPIDEDHPVRPMSFYGLSKLTAERYALLESTLWGLPAVCLRYFNVYGLPSSRSDYAGVISIFCDRLRAGQPLTIYGDGLQCRDFIHVHDVVQANLLAAERGPAGSVYNIGTGQRITLLDLAQTLARLAGVEPTIVHLDERPGEIRESVADVTRAAAELGFKPAYDLTQGLAQVWQGSTPAS